MGVTLTQTLETSARKWKGNGVRGSVWQADGSYSCMDVIHQMLQASKQRGKAAQTGLRRSMEEHVVEKVAIVIAAGV